MVRTTDKWTKGDVIHFVWITGAVISVIIFLNTTHVLISKNSDFCEADEDVDDFLKRNNVLLGLPESTLDFENEDFAATNDDKNGHITAGEIVKEIPDKEKDNTDRKSKKLHAKDTTMVQVAKPEVVTPSPSSGNVLRHLANESGKSRENQTREEADDFGSSGDTADKLPLSPRTNTKKFSTWVPTSTTSTTTTSTSTATTSTTTTSTTTKIHFMDKLTPGNGRWRQVKTVGMDEFLKAEGGNWIYRSLASSAVPDFIYTRKGDNHYQQKIEVSVFPSQVNQIYFDKEYTFEDQFGDKVSCYAKNYGDYTESVTTGGRGGKMRSFMQLVNNQLFLTTILEDKNNVKAVRIFEKQ